MRKKKPQSSRFFNVLVPLIGGIVTALLVQTLLSDLARAETRISGVIIRPGDQKFFDSLDPSTCPKKGTKANAEDCAFYIADIYTLAKVPGRKYTIAQWAAVAYDHAMRSLPVSVREDIENRCQGALSSDPSMLTYEICWGQELLEYLPNKQGKVKRTLNVEQSAELKKTCKTCDAESQFKQASDLFAVGLHHHWQAKALIEICNWTYGDVHACTNALKNQPREGHPDYSLRFFADQDVAGPKFDLFVGKVQFDPKNPSMKPGAAVAGAGTQPAPKPTPKTTQKPGDKKTPPKKDPVKTPAGPAPGPGSQPQAQPQPQPQPAPSTVADAGSGDPQPEPSKAPAPASSGDAGQSGTAAPAPATSSSGTAPTQPSAEPPKDPAPPAAPSTSTSTTTTPSTNPPQPPKPKPKSALDVAAEANEKLPDQDPLGKDSLLKNTSFSPEAIAEARKLTIPKGLLGGAPMYRTKGQAILYGAKVNAKFTDDANAVFFAEFSLRAGALGMKLLKNDLDASEVEQFYNWTYDAMVDLKKALPADSPLQAHIDTSLEDLRNLKKNVDDKAKNGWFSKTAGVTDWVSAATDDDKLPKHFCEWKKTAETLRPESTLGFPKELVNCAEF